MAIRVLLAEPEAALLEAYRSFLTRDGFEIETASTGSECLTKLHEWHADVLLLEPEMPDGLGERIVDEVMHDVQMQDLPILILTWREHAPAAWPVREYHVKPYPMTKLANSIRAAADHVPASNAAELQRDVAGD